MVFLAQPEPLQAQTNWTGAVDNDYQDSGNWDNGLPSTTNTGIIGDGEDVGVFSGTFNDDPANLKTDSNGTLRLGDGVNATNQDIQLEGWGVGFNGALSTFDNASASWGGDVTVLSNARMGTGDGGFLEVSGDIDGSATWRFNPETGNGVLRLSGSNSYTGKFIVQNGTVEAGSNSALGTSDGITDVQAGNALHLMDGVNVSGETVEIAGNGTNFAGALSTTDNASATWGGDVVLKTNSRIGTGNGGSLEVTGTISGSDNVTIRNRDNAGVVTLSGNNSYTGRTDVFVGTLRVDSSDALNGTSNVRIRPTGGDSALVLGDGVAINKTLELEGQGVGFGGALTTASGGSASWNGNVSLDTSGSNMRVSADGGTLTLGGDISGGDSGGALFIRPVNGGTVEFTGTNTYASVTQVIGGTFLVNGDNSGATGDVLVGNSGVSATLGGTGTVGGTTTIDADGTLSPGNSIGTLNFDDTLTLNDGASILFEFEDNSEAGVSYDQIVGSSMILPESGTITLTIEGLAGHSVAANDAFTLFTGALSSFDPANFNIVNQSDWTGGWELSEGSLVLTAIPEPSAYAFGFGLAALGAVVLLRRGRGKARRS